MAARFLVAGGTGNWNSTTNWSATSGGSSGASFPTSADTVTMDSNSGNANITVNVSSACLSLTMSGTYAGTLTFNAQLSVSGSITFLSTCTLAGTTGPLVAHAAGTLTSAGKTVPCGLTFDAGVTYTLADNWTVTGLVISSTASTTINGNQITCNGGFRNTGGFTTSGTTKLVIAGGTWDNPTSGLTNVNVDLAGNVTVSGSITWGTSGKTLKYVSGTITTTGSTLTGQGGTFDTNGVTWNNFTANTNGATYTFSSNFAWSGTFTVSNNLTLAGAGTLVGPGNFTLSGAVTCALSNTGGLSTTGSFTWPNANATLSGTSGMTVGTMTTASITTSTKTHTLTAGNTYTVTTALNNVGTTSSIRQALVSSDAVNRAILTVQSGASMSLNFCDPTRIDSSAGLTVVSSSATITDTLNWSASTTPTIKFNNYITGAKGALGWYNERIRKWEGRRQHRPETRRAA